MDIFGWQNEKFHLLPEKERSIGKQMKNKNKMKHKNLKLNLILGFVFISSFI